MGSESSDVKSKSSSGTAVALLVFTMVALLVAAAVGLILHFTLEREPTPVDRVRAVGNCLPQNVQDKDSCIKRRYVDI